MYAVGATRPYKIEIKRNASLHKDPTIIAGQLRDLHWRRHPNWKQITATLILRCGLQKIAA
jgi:hypothetical protein